MKKILLLLLTFITFASYADDYKPQIKFDKTVNVTEAVAGDKLWITLEAYSEGKVVYMERAQKLDICLVVDNSSSMQNNKFSNGQTRWQVFKAAAIQFCDSVNAQAIRNNVDHRMSIVSFDANADIEIDWTNNIKSVHDKVNSMVTGSGTNQWMGLDYGKTMMSSARSDAKKILIIMTDGEPYANDSKSPYKENSRQTVMNKSLEVAQQIKDSGVELYAMGIFPNGNSKVTDCNLTCIQYMKYLSSCTKWTKNSQTDVHSTEPSNEKHYFTASDAATLNNIFTTILEKTTITALTPGTGYSVKDIINPEAFKVPDGTKPEDIKVYVSDALTRDGYTVSAWGPEIPLNDAKVTLNGNDVTIGNFDFGKHYVGPGGDSPQKLIIKIPIEVKDIDLDDDGTFKTNKVGSAIYDDHGIPVANFPFPTVILRAANYYIELYADGLADSYDLINITLGSRKFDQIVSNETVYKFKCTFSEGSNVKFNVNNLCSPITFQNATYGARDGKRIQRVNLHYAGTGSGLSAIVHNTLKKK